MRGRDFDFGPFESVPAGGPFELVGVPERR